MSSISKLQKVFIVLSYLLALATAVLCCMIVPGFEAFFIDMGAALPTITQFVLTYYLFLMVLPILFPVLVGVLCRRSKKIGSTMLFSTLLFIFVFAVFILGALYSPIFTIPCID